MLGQFDDLPFGDSADLIEVQAALALGFFRINRGTKKCVGDHHDSRDGDSSNGSDQFPINDHAFQR
jgi:hypothetical protein